MSTRISRGLGIALVVVLLSAGAAIAARIHCDPNTRCTGTAGKDELVGSSAPDRIYGRGGNDHLRGRGGGDRLDGGEGGDVVRGHGGRDVIVDRDHSTINDFLVGGSGPDRVWGWGFYVLGKSGNDVLQGQVLDGGEGDDLLLGQGNRGEIFQFEDGWGNDRIKAGPNMENTVGLSDVTVDVTVNLHSKGSRPEVESSEGGWTVDWRNDTIRAVHGSEGDDWILGNGYRNTILAMKGGNDTIYGGAGDDRINVADEGDFESADVVDCGKGERDHVRYDRGVDTIKNCELRRPS